MESSIAGCGVVADSRVAIKCLKSNRCIVGTGGVTKERTCPDGCIVHSRAKSEQGGIPFSGIAVWIDSVWWRVDRAKRLQQTEARDESKSAQEVPIRGTEVNSADSNCAHLSIFHVVSSGLSLAGCR